MFDNFKSLKDLIKGFDFLVVNDDVKVYLKTEKEAKSLIDNLTIRNIKYSISNKKQNDYACEIIVKNNDTMRLKKDAPYDYIYKSFSKNNANPFPSVVGHKEQKEELSQVIEWFKNSKSLRERGLSIPRGVLLYGSPGNGKSLLIKEVIKIAEAPVFVFKGDEDNISRGLLKVFNDAKKEGHAIIVIDEIDLLIDKDNHAKRVLQEQLDGVESADDLLVIAATNDLFDVPDALKRNGRLEKIIEIEEASGEDAVKLLKRCFKEFNVALPVDFNEEEIANALDEVEFSRIKAIVNDIFLRNGFENITMAMIEKSIENITKRAIKKEEKSVYQTAIHEAGHAVMANSFPELFRITNLKINGGEGECCCHSVNRNLYTYEKAIADIKISMAGLLAEKLICGTGTLGAEDDLQRARSRAYNLFNINGYSSCWETLPSVYPHTRAETYIKKRRMERKIERFLRKCERETKSYIKKNTDKVKKLADRLFAEKYLKASEVLSIIR